jgi:hypothetical protein
MENMNSIFALLLGLLLRIGIPAGVTVLLVMWLRRLDAHWQKQAQAQPRTIPLAVNSGCWDVHNCPPEKRAHCKAYAHPETPCWQVFRSTDGTLREACLGCEVFRSAPVPAAG